MPRPFCMIASAMGCVAVLGGGPARGETALKPAVPNLDVSAALPFTVDKGANLRLDVPRVLPVLPRIPWGVAPIQEGLTMVLPLMPLAEGDWRGIGGHYAVEWQLGPAKPNGAVDTFGFEARGNLKGDGFVGGRATWRW